MGREVSRLTIHVRCGEVHDQIQPADKPQRQDVMEIGNLIVERVIMVFALYVSASMANASAGVDQHMFPFNDQLPISMTSLPLRFGRQVGI